MTHVWVTRTQPAADRFASELRRAGFSVSVEPLIRVRPTDSELQYKPADVAVFLSQHAAHMVDLDKLNTKRYLAIGNATRREVHLRGIKSCEIPEVASSEGLLAWFNEHAGGASSVLIVKGVGGRTLLRDRLLSRGMAVEECEVYRRERVKLRRTFDLRFDAIEVSSVEALRALIGRVSPGEQHILESADLVIASRRIATEACKAGFRNVHIAQDTSARAFAIRMRQLPLLKLSR